MSANPLVSVIIPCFEHGDYIREAISSVLAQSYSNVEIIVVDDGSVQHSAEPVIREFSDSPVPLKFFKHESRQGSAAARNLAIRNSSGELILPLDADDHLAPTYLEKTVEAMSDVQAGCVYTDMQLFGTQNDCYSPTISIVTALAGDPIPICTLYRRSVYDAVGGYREGLDIGEDTDFGIRILILGFKYIHVPEPLYFYRKHASSSSTKYIGGGSIQAIESVYLEHRELFIEHLPEILRLKENRYCELQNQYNHLNTEFHKVLQMMEQDLCVERGVRNNFKILLKSLQKRCGVWL